MDTILKSELLASLNGERCKRPYRAVLKPSDSGALIAIEQPFNNGDWGGCGQWYLETLLDGLNDGLSIDYGQRWQIDKGMRNALIEASVIAAKAYVANKVID